MDCPTHKPFKQACCSGIYAFTSDKILVERDNSIISEPAKQPLQLQCPLESLLAAITVFYDKILMRMQIEELETQMAQMHQSSAVLAEAESSLRQQLSGLQVGTPQCRAPACA